VKIPVLADPPKARLLPCWKTSAASELDVVWPVPRKSPHPTDKATIALMPCITVRHPGTIIASVLNRQKGKLAAGASFTPRREAGLRRNWKIPRDQASGKLQRVGTAADPFGLADSAPMAAGQTYCGRANCSVCSVADMTMGQAPPTQFAMPEAILRCGTSRQANMQRVKHGGLTVARTRRGEQKALHINALHQQSPAL
jgi:hypothetical protein